MSRLQASRGALRLIVYRPLLAAAAVVVALDQATKELALAKLADGPVHVLGGVVTFRLTYNSGGAFGLLQGLPGLFLLATFVVAAGIVVLARRLERHSPVVALGLVLGGGLGNLADRLFRGLGGRVVDFVDLHFWPVFNVADAAIVIGVCWIVLAGARAGRVQAPG